jgi:UDP-N-acetylglucosamine--N-acetylmuramyl-(pentapeptide) pyrophosphoryl-undecaprenol N-acetylglucosamine transferase
MHHTGSRMPDNIKCIKFIDRMDMAYAASDVIISRAGALTLSEICLLGKPAILIPSPNVAEDHQTKNALALVQQNAAVLVRDQEAAVKMIPEALKLLRNIEMQRFLAVNCAKMALPDAAQKIADEVFKILNDHD